MLGERCTGERRQPGQRVTLSTKAEHVTVRRPCWADTGRPLRLAFPASSRVDVVCIYATEGEQSGPGYHAGRYEAARGSSGRARGAIS